MKLLLCLLFPLAVFGQPFNFKSTGTKKPIELTLGWVANGKGAYVLYKGKTELIPLKLKSYKRDTSKRSDPQPDVDSYKWEEMYQGKVTGEYGVTVMLKSISDMYYIRHSDGKRFSFNYVEDTKSYDGKATVLLHGVRLDYAVYDTDELRFGYPDRSIKDLSLTALPDGGARRAVVADYNFDGIDDVAFSVPDGGMGVYRIYDIFIYNPVSKKFTQLQLPKVGKMVCDGLCDVRIDKKHKQLTTSCRGGASWHMDYYRYDKVGKLVWLKSGTDNK
ncbi:XAC2610-related protein [Pedobacter caeni]|nr:hypothetical protein [Pedobacter caeni]